MSAVYFIDVRVADFQTLIDSLDPGSDYFLIDGQSDGLEQIVTRLQGHGDLDALHIVSHGSQGVLYLGSTVLDGSTIADHAATLAEIGGALTDSGDILLYGCNVAAGEAGRAFIETLAELTGADVAASEDITGSLGNWQLEASTGPIESNSIQSDWGGQLDIFIGSAGANTLIGTVGDDTLTGKNGNDTLNGGAGTDIAMYEGILGHYQFGLDAQQRITVTDVFGFEGVDSLIGIEQAGFWDGAITVFHNVETRVNTYTTGDQRAPAVAVLSGGGHVVVWQSMGQDGELSGIYAQRYAADGTAVGAEARVNLYTPDAQVAPAVAALAGGGYVVTWQSYGGEGDGWSIFAQRFAADGTVDDGNPTTDPVEARVNTTVTDFQTAPAVSALAGGGYVVTWQAQGQDGSGYGIYAQRYDASGNAVGVETQVNTTVTNSQIAPAVAALTGGGHVVTWMSEAQDGSGYGIYAQRYDTAGNAAGAETRINTTTANDQTAPAVAALAGGGYVLTWQAEGQDGSASGIYAQRYDASGNAAGTETRVNTTTTDYQTAPAVVALAGGGYAVTWESAGQTNSGAGTYAQRYDASGNAVGAETRVNTTASGEQFDATVTALSDGGYRVTWAALGQDGSGLGIYSQRYDADGNASVLAGDGNGNLLRWSAASAIVLNGGLGADNLVGSAGDDTLIGGGGNDLFGFASGGNGVDTITDFSYGDVIRVDGAGFAGSWTTGSGSALAVNGIALESGTGATTLHIGTDATPGGDVHIVLQGTFIPGQLLSGGTDISWNPNPYFSSGDSGTVAEKSATSTVIYDAAAIDPLSAPISFSLGGTDAALLNIDADTGEVRLNNQANFHVKASYSFDVVASNGGQSATKSILVGVSNVNDAPVLAAVASAPTFTDTAADDSFANPTGTLTANDVDGNTLSYGISGGTDNGTTVSKLGSYGTLVVTKATGGWQYQPADAAIEGIKGNASDSFTVTASDGNTSDSKTFTVSLTGADDVPVLSAVSSAPTLADTSADDSFANQTGTLTAGDADGDTLSYGIAGGTDNGATFSKVGSYGTLVVTKATGAWQYQPVDAAIEALKVSASDSFTVTASDGNTSDSKTFTVNLTATNDTTSFGGTLGGSVAEDGLLSASGTLTTSDREAGDDGIVAQPNVIGTYGSFSIDAAGAWSYMLNNAAANVQALNGGETATDSFAVVSVGGTTQTVTLSIAGADDTPVLAAVSSAPTFTDTGADDSFANQTGTLTASDADGDALSYGIVGGTDNGATFSKVGSYGTLIVTKATGGWQYQPVDAAIEGIKGNASDSFTVTASDGNASDSETFTVNLTGVNDVTTFGGHLAGSVAEDGQLTASGTLTSSDRDAGDAVIVVQTNATGTYGSFSIDASGAWSYTLNNAAVNVQALRGGQTVSDVFAVSTAGGSSQNLAITVSGVNDTVGDVGANELTGTIGGDTLTGNAGNDTLEGGAGTDMATYSSTTLGYRFGLDAQQRMTVTDTDTTNGDEGADSLIGIEQAGFSDGAITVFHHVETRVNTTTAGDQRAPAVAALSGGGQVVVWQSMGQDGDLNGIYAQRYAADGTAVGAETRVNTTTVDAQVESAVTALSGGGYVATWQSHRVGGGDWDIYAQRYDASGNAVGVETRVNTTVTDFQTAPAVSALAGGGYVVTWQAQGQDGSGYGIYAQRYDASGNAVGVETQVNTTVTNSQIAPAVAALTGGGHVVTWMSEAQDGSGYGIYAQRYDAAGNAAGAETRINTTTANDQTAPAVAALSGGGYVLTWQAEGQDGSASGIYAQRYDASGNAAGTETRVNTTTTDYQTAPAVVALAGGGYAVTWESAGQTNSGAGTYAQRYDASGNAVGAETRVNTTASGEQFDATVTALSDGGYRVTWAALGQDGSGLGIYSQRYDADGNASVLAGDGSANTLTWSGTTRMVLDGRAGNDSLNGSFSSDTLEGGAGNDVLSGGLGHDTALFGGVLSGYTIVKSDTQFTVTDTNVANGDDGIDTLFYVERLQFADAEVGLAIPPSMGVGDPEYPANWLDYYTVADFNGDGKTDLWWKTKAGVVGVWTTDAASVWQGDAMRDVFHDWSTVDQNGDGIAEIARQHLANGASIQWSDASAEITAGQLGLDHGWAMF